MKCYLVPQLDNVPLLVAIVADRATVAFPLLRGGHYISKKIQLSPSWIFFSPFLYAVWKTNLIIAHGITVGN